MTTASLRSSPNSAAASTCEAPTATSVQSVGSGPFTAPSLGVGCRCGTGGSVAAGSGRGAPTSAPRPCLSVVLTTTDAGAAASRTLISLDAQTLPHDRFEVVVVHHGAATRPSDVRALHAAGPGLTVRGVEATGADLATARDLGVSLARAEHVILLDDGARLSPPCLEGLLRLTAPGVVPSALVVTETSGGSALGAETRSAPPWRGNRRGSRRARSAARSHRKAAGDRTGPPSDLHRPDARR